MGRIPIRRGFDGVVSRSWADGSLGWSGYIAPEQLPRRIDPVIGFVVSANNRPVGKQYPYLIGHGFDNGYRAWRIAQRLQSLSAITKQDMLRLQLDTRSEFYQFYRDLALQVLTPQAIETEPARAQLRNELLAWNGDAELESRGVGLLIEFRERLADSVLTPFLAACRKNDNDFQYRWPHLDTPLQAILNEKHPKLLPAPERYPDWNTFILAKLEESAQTLRKRHRVGVLHDLHWGRLNIPKFSHPLSEGIPGLGGFLDMLADPLPGCEYCVRYAYASGGASERLVVSPGHPEAGILHMLGGQSGHPLSPHYRDQHPYWVKGQPIPFASNEALHALRFEPLRK
jgi:penicillin G amidase